jgi:hypothetical protein
MMFDPMGRVRQLIGNGNLLPFIDHAEFFHQVPDDVLADMLPLAKKVAVAIGLDNGQYNLLQVIYIIELKL